MVESSEISSFEQTTSSSSLQHDPSGMLVLFLSWISASLALAINNVCLFVVAYETPERTNGQIVKMHDSLPDRVAADVLSEALPVAAAKISPQPFPASPFCLRQPPIKPLQQPGLNPLITGVTQPQPSLTAKPAPNTAPAPWSRPAGPPARTFPPSSVTSSIPAPGRSSVAGSKESPKRGRGQLKPSVSPGSRIPVCGVCQVPVR